MRYSISAIDRRRLGAVALKSAVRAFRRARIWLHGLSDETVGIAAILLIVLVGATWALSA